jgi:hypothetical protein
MAVNWLVPLVSMQAEVADKGRVTGQLADVNSPHGLTRACPERQCDLLPRARAQRAHEAAVQVERVVGSDGALRTTPSSRNSAWRLA